MYVSLGPTVAVSQGDIFDSCPIYAVEPSSECDLDAAPTHWRARVIVLTQACDLAQTKTTRVLVALVHSAHDLVSKGILKAAFVRDQVRRGMVYGWYFLPCAPSPVLLPESIVDLRDLHTVPRAFLEQLNTQGSRLCRLATPYREHLAQHFAVTYSRIGLPEPYETRP